jgi:predicted nucleic-acid-binding protein
MIGLDTNVLLRLGDGKTPEQRDRSLALIRAQGRVGCFVNAIVLSEFVWTLRSSLKMTRAEVAVRLEILLDAPEFVIEKSAEATRALARYRSGPADFADYFLAEINRSAGCATTATFDDDALKSGELFSGVPALS